jgi:hypothetical protein
MYTIDQEKKQKEVLGSTWASGRSGGIRVLRGYEVQRFAKMLLPSSLCCRFHSRPSWMWIGLVSCRISFVPPLFFLISYVVPVIFWRQDALRWEEEYGAGDVDAPGRTSQRK